MPNWNLWHGCRKISAGCQNCYVYRIDGSYGKSDSFIVRRTADFSLPLKKDRAGNYKLTADGGLVYTCMTSDFFIEDADLWRQEAWDIIKSRPDLDFCIVTKRITQAESRLPADWGEGYDNVTIACTVENNAAARLRLPVFNALPIKHRFIFCSPLLEQVELGEYLDGIDEVSIGGESGENARECRWEWIEEMFNTCREKGVPCYIHQLGAKFVKDGRTYRLPNRKVQHWQARKAQDLLESGYTDNK